ncbi:MAG: hypothetical protein AAF443_06580 [Chlamydiota bacterium]
MGDTACFSLLEPLSALSAEEWLALNSDEEDFLFSPNPHDPNIKLPVPIECLPVDFSLKTKAAAISSSSSVYFLVLNALFSPWKTTVALAKYVVQRCIMIPLYLGQSRICQRFYPLLAPKTAAINGYHATQRLQQAGFIVKHVVLERDGIRYSGLLIGHKTTITNGNWALQATGNACPIELIYYRGQTAAECVAHAYFNHAFNTLLINGPSVGRSQGHATPESMGQTQELGIQFLATALKAKSLILAGHSLGGAAIGLAINQHEFKPEITYMVIRQMTFDRASHVCSCFAATYISAKIEHFINWLVRWAGCEMDSVKASKKLKALGICEIIIRASEDPIISAQPSVYDAQLGETLKKEAVIPKDTPWIPITSPNKNSNAGNKQLVTFEGGHNSGLCSISWVLSKFIKSRV